MQWDTYCKCISSLDDAGEVVHAEVKFPFPLSNRDYVYARQVVKEAHGGAETRVVVMKAYVSPAFVTRLDVIWVGDKAEVVC